jgi:dihydroorotate dehydrogenase electron transfer subunit
MIEQKTEIIFNREIAHDTFLMGLRSPEMVAAASPGQFVMVRVRPGIDPLLRRPLSICAVQDDELLLILYRVVGKGTAIMAETPEGERFSVLGPLGKGFVLPNPQQQSILVAGGMGVAPLLFLAQHIKNGPFQLMMGFGSAGEIIALEQILDQPIDFVIATDDGSAGHAGPVTDLLEAQLNQHEFEKGAASIFTCGPQPMMKKVAAMAFERDIACQASLEAVMACGLGVCQGCSVKAASKEEQTYYHVCSDGPVFLVKAIDWND